MLRQDRGKKWDDISVSLQRFEVMKNYNGRYVRERYTTLMKLFTNKNNTELKASGIDADYSERDNLLQDCYDLERDHTELVEQEQKQKEEKAKKATDMRQKCLESMKETKERERLNKKRKIDQDNSMLIEYLKQRKEDHMALRERELKMQEKQLEEQKRMNERDRILREKELEQKDVMIQTLQSMVESQQKLIEELLKSREI